MIDPSAVRERPRVCVVGSLHLDIMVRTHHLPHMGETLIGQTWGWKPGGKGGNQAVAAALVSAFEPREYAEDF